MNVVYKLVLGAIAAGALAGLIAILFFGWLPNATMIAAVAFYALFLAAGAIIEAT